jgi:hypothetical protein
MMRFLIFLLVFVLPMTAVAETYHVRSGGQAACAVAEAYQTPAGVEVDNSFKLDMTSVKFPVTVDMVQAFALAVPVGTEMNPEFGMIEIKPDGKVFYNDQDISSRVEEVCNK